MKLGDTFLTFDEFEIELNKFCENNFTHLTKTDSATSEVEGEKYDYIVYKCIQHQDPAKIKSRGKGIRLQQHYNASNCPLYIRLTYRKCQLF